MKADKNIATYRRMRNQPLWRLLASGNGPTVIGLLQSHLYEKDRSLPASILFERLTRDLEELRAQGDDFPQTAQAYVANWLSDGYLERRFPPGSTEEEYELSTATVEAIRLLAAIVEPHSAATDRLVAEQARIDKEIQAIEKGQMRVLPRDTALERTREIISLTNDLTGDFRRVRDQFEQLNRDLRERIMDSDGNRGEVLDSLFAGIDLITESEAGRTFSAFWRLLTDPEQAAMLEESLDGVMSREFVSELDMRERRFLLRLTRNLLEQGGAVHALTIKDEIKTTESLEYSLELTSSRLRSLSQWVLYDPSLQAEPEAMREGEPPPIDLESVSELVAQSEIDFRTLKEHVFSLLEQREQASIGEVLEHFPAEQGLGSVVGLLALGSRHGIKGADVEADSVEMVAWVGEDDQGRRARIPKIYFLRDRLDELA